MRRRAFIAGLSSAAAWPVVAHAQPTPVVGFVSPAAPESFAHALAAFRDGVKQEGYVEGQNVVIDYRWGRGRYDLQPALTAELVSRGVNVIVGGGGFVQTAKSVPATIPIAMMFGGDPVQTGLVNSLNRPGGNVTGVSLFAFSLGGKRLELLRETVPTARIVAVLSNPSIPDSASDRTTVEAVAQTIGQQIVLLTATNDGEIESAFAKLADSGAGGLLVMADPYFNQRREYIVSLAARHAVPAIYEWRQFAELGGLMSYGSSITDAYRHLGSYTGKILKGARPVDLPIIQTVKVELVINLKTAKTLGLTFPLALLGRADEVIE